MLDICCNLSFQSGITRTPYGEQTDDILKKVKDYFAVDLSFLKDKMLESEARHALTFTYFGPGIYEEYNGEKYNCVMELYREKPLRFLFIEKKNKG